MQITFHYDAPTSEVPLPADAIAVWVLNAASPWKPIEELKSLLDGGELARAERYTIDEPRLQFILHRGSLRLLLSRYGNVEPHRIEIETAASGKPFMNVGSLEFNVAHSGRVGVIAVSHRRVGVDVEVIRPMPNNAGLVKRFFSREEQQQFANLPEDLKLAGFFRGWTGKEALLKAVGVGLVDLESCAVDLDPRHPPQVMRFDHSAEAGRQWQLKVNTIETAIVSVAFEAKTEMNH